jgi:hypothetical protein
MIRLYPSRVAAALLVAALAGLAAPAAAQGVSPPVQTMRAPAAPAAPSAVNSNPDDPAFADLIDAIEATVDQDKLITNGLEAVKRQFASDPTLAAAESASPGLIDEIVENLRPIIKQQNRRVTALYRPEMIAAIAAYLTPEEAASVAAFYRSDIGRKLMSNVVANYDFDSTISTMMDDKPVTADQVRDDINSAVNQGVAQLSRQELMEMGRLAMANPALMKLQRVNPEIQLVRVKMENAPLTEEENAAIVAVVEGIFARRFPQ